ncbi:hypothetical protein [Photorhabdus australis]
MLPGIRSLAVAMHLEIYWVYKLFQQKKIRMLPPLSQGLKS